MSGNQTGYTILDTRGVLAIPGEDRVAFLQGLVSNDMRRVAADRTLYALFLTPQGKYLHDFFVLERDGALLLEVEAGRRDDLLKRLKIYKLRSRIALEDRSAAWTVAAVYGPDALERLGLPAEPGATRPFAGGVAVTDPRHAGLGARVLLPAGDATEALAAAGLAALPAEAYETLRLSLGIPDASRDLPPERAIPLENRLDTLNAIAWDKGCYMGQELTARTHYRALIRRKLFPVRVDGPLPEPGTPVTAGEREVGELRSGAGGLALAMLRLEEVERAAADGRPLLAGEAALTPFLPGWAAPEAATTP